jgi:hypothetical protein
LSGPWRLGEVEYQNHLFLVWFGDAAIRSNTCAVSDVIDQKSNLRIGT